MHGSLVCIYSLTAIAPLGPMASPASRASSTFGRTPTATITICAGIVRLSVLTAATRPLPSNATVFSSRYKFIPAAATGFAASSAISKSSICGRMRFCISTTLTLTPILLNSSASSMPIKPAPTITTSVTLLAAISSLTFKTSHGNQKLWMPSKSAPGTGRRTGAAPVPSTSTS